jgi:hypothetical protein
MTPVPDLLILPQQRQHPAPLGPLLEPEGEFGAEHMGRPAVRRMLAAQGENNLQTLGAAPGEKDLTPLALRPRHVIAYRDEACTDLAQPGAQRL